MAVGQPRINIVTHAWAGKHQHYAKCLTYQIASLVLYPPKQCHVTHTLMHAPDDFTIMRTVLDALFLVRQRMREAQFSLCFMAYPLPIEQLGRRAIGRNMVAKHTLADLVWFTDCDYLFRDGILDRLAELEWPEGTSMIYPRSIMQTHDHATGDRIIAKMSKPELLDVDPADFTEKRFNRAIGGVQIVQGDFARKHGYLDGDEKWQRPLDRKTFASCQCDRAYRNRCLEHGPIVPVDLPGVFRIRHTETTHHDK